MILFREMLLDMSHSPKELRSPMLARECGTWDKTMQNRIVDRARTVQRDSTEMQP